MFRRRAVSAGTFDVYDEAGRLLLYSKQNPFKFADDFRLYSGEGREVLVVKTPKTMREGHMYEVQDVATSELVGKIKLTGLLLREEWTFMSNEGKENGKVLERVVWGLLHRILRVVPQRYVVISGGGRKVAEVRQHFMWWVLKYTMTILEPEPVIDRRLLLASVILAGTEGKFVIPS